MDSAATSSSSDGVRQTHVLIVDDCRATLRLYETIFKKCACKVTTAENGVKALEFLGLSEEKQSSENENVIRKVNLISLDCEMPGMNGYELLKKIKESSSVKDVPVVIVSSTDNPTVINKFLETGALKFITKPLKISDVENLMTSIK